MTEIVVGRAGDASVVSVGSQFKSVSRRHLALSPVDGSNCRLADLGSSNGTEALVDGKWRKIDKAIVATDQRLRLGGEYETSVRDLLALAERQGKLARREGSASTVCPICGGPVSGSYCSSCQTHVDLDARGFVGLMAEDMLGLREKAGYMPYLWRLATSPVTTSVALARDPNFRLHGAFFAISSALYLGISKFAASPDEKQIPALEKISGFVDIAAVMFYVYFIFGFIITYYVFKDYSRKPKSPRGYLKLCCINSLVNTTALLVLILSLALISGLVGGSSDAQDRLSLFFMMVFVVFVMQYYLRTNMRFWEMSAVSAFRGLVISYVLAVILMFLIIAFVSVVFYFLTGDVLFESAPTNADELQGAGSL